MKPQTKSITLGLVVLFIACTGAIVTKASQSRAAYYMTTDSDITDMSNYLMVSGAGCGYGGTVFCCIKVSDSVDGTPVPSALLRADLQAIKDGTNPTSNRSGQVRFRY